MMLMRRFSIGALRVGVLWLCLALLINAYAVKANLEIAPWHLQEDPADERIWRPKLVRINGGHHQQRSRTADGPFLYHPPSGTSDGYVRKRREPKPGSSLYYWYHTLFHHTNSNAKLGPERPTRTTRQDPPTYDSSYTVAAYYYPWYHTDFHGRKYIRGELKPPMLPVLGEYDDRNASVIRQHLEWSRQANINLWVASWWGPGSGTDITIRDHIRTNPHLEDHNFCLFYETMGRIDTDAGDTSKVYDDIAYAARTYFRNPNYYKLDDRPVLFVYLTRVLERLGLLAEVMSLIRTAVFQETGQLVYIVGDHTYGSPPDGPLESFNWLDAATNYDIFGSLGRPNGHATTKAVDEYAVEQAAWRKQAHAQGCAYIPGATPGYNDKAVREADYNAMSRKLDKGQPYGTLFRSLLREGKTLVDGSTGNLLIVNSFNEWHEDTQIEPVVRGEMTVKPWNLTRGYVYEGYGEEYLDILATETAVFAEPQ